jgi:hypothetical protein
MMGATHPVSNGSKDGGGYQSNLFANLVFGQSYFEWLKNCHRRTPPMFPAAAIAVVVVITQTALVQDSHNPFTTLIPCLQTIGRVAISWQASSNITQ